MLSRETIRKNKSFFFFFEVTETRKRMDCGEVRREERKRRRKTGGGGGGGVKEIKILWEIENLIKETHASNIFSLGF